MAARWDYFMAADSEARVVNRVSTLTRAEARVLHNSEPLQIAGKQFQPSPEPKPGCCGHRRRHGGAAPGFNPHPSRSPGAALARSRNWPPPSGFNPHPSRSPGAATQPHPRPPRGRVSTLTRAEARVLRFTCASVSSALELFQPSPEPKPGCCTRAEMARQVERLFQPSPEPKPGCCTTTRSTGRRPSGFNPHPSRSPGAALVASSTASPIRVFQPSPEPKPGCCGLGLA